MDCDVASYHIESYNFMADEGLQLAAENVPTTKLRLPSGDAVEISYAALRLGYPALESSSSLSDATKIYPAECRQRALTYRAPLRANIDLSVNGRKIDSLECLIGEVPVMLKSNRCHLDGLSKSNLIKRGEEGIEKGGYFIVNGSEKVMRLLIANKRNFPLAIQRRTLRDKGKLFSDSAIMMRCVKDNHSAALIHLHYLESASIMMSIQFSREIFYVPLMYVLKALTTMNDAMIYEHLTRARPGDAFWAGCVTNMLSMAQDEGIVSQQTAWNALGSRFRVVLGHRIAPWENDDEAAKYLFKFCVAIHLNTDEQKFFCLTLMAQKLIALVKEEITPESLDNPQFQEASVSGHIMLLIIRERLENILTFSRRRIEEMAKKKPDTFKFTGKEFIKSLASHKGGEITRGLEYFLATGNLVTKNGLGLMQTTGFSVIAERINQLRFVSHFRAIHRGAFFMEMRTTDVRKLRPEAWGFICPVHTPDGAPCGLLNHVTASCRIVTHFSVVKKLQATLLALGMIPHNMITLVNSEPVYPVVVDGDFMGYIPRAKATFIERQLRAIKVTVTDDRVPYITEIALIRHSTDPTNVITQFPGLYLYTAPGRMIRPVKNLAFNITEFIGVFEQVYLSVIIDPEEAEPGVTMHQELHPTALFSFAGNLIPFPDHNQSPRNVYQCQMGKQTMGVPVHAWRHRADGKMYLLQYPQKPLLKLEAHDKYEMDEYPLGTNACVAVISYTGYDMEDAMVINRGSYQRGFAHGCVLKVERINLVERRGFQTSANRYFFSDATNRSPGVGEDGLPIQGRLYREGDHYYSTFDLSTGSFQNQAFKYAEPAYCNLVRIVDENFKEKVHALIQWRIPRNPIIGDKFASRHGQKGINSFLWPPESLPFSDSGMVPDIVFNPHGFPSRMTIGMMIESMAGKAAAMHGSTYDASPFVFNETDTAIGHFGKLLQKAGYNYMGNETMYSGVDGRVMQVEIFFGLVYYQRLRHMIADKFQVRATGPVDPVTLQPVKGRKKGGGVRFGEMERDALIAHGTAFCLQDRLFNCSDKDEAYMCAGCGSIVSVTQLRPNMAMFKRVESAFKAQNRIEKESNYHNFTRRHCSVCKRDDQVFLVNVPRVFRYLCAELSAVNVKVQLGVSHPKDIKR